MSDIMAADISSAVQSTVGKRTPRFADKNKRDWSLFFFFRILSQADADRGKDRLREAAAVSEFTESADVETHAMFTPIWQQEVIDQAMQNAGVLQQKMSEPVFDGKDFDGETSNTSGPMPENAESGDSSSGDSEEREPAPDGPAQEFLNWIRIVSSANGLGLLNTFAEMIDQLAEAELQVLPESNAAGIYEPENPIIADPESPATIVEKIITALQDNDLTNLQKYVDETVIQLIKIIKFPQQLNALIAGLMRITIRFEKDPAKLRMLLAALVKAIAGIFVNTDLLAIIKDAFGNSPAEAGLTALRGKLPIVTLFELIRQVTPAATTGNENDAAIRAETLSPSDIESAPGNPFPFDPVPITLAFTHSGLSALSLDKTTLSSFPDVFKQGMAARAERLGDTGPSAPSNWDGALGLKSVHGYFTGGFLVGGPDARATEADWRELRSDVRAFNNHEGDRGTFLRALLGGIFKIFGMEIVHIELGQDPYDLRDGEIDYPADPSEKIRKEHFGFRDGISQPFKDMKLGRTLSGGGVPGRRRSWKPVEPGEIYLGAKDEDGEYARQPFNSILRHGGTYLVFRKLEQDVVGFRAFLAKNRSTETSQDKLAAQLMGRWQNGTSMVHSPDHPSDVQEEKLNDFLYATDDPDGAKCPLGSHVRRANPRDIGERNDVRRHRILRRSIAYGGPFLPKGSPGDDEERGLLFVAANSRIDLQFEVIQSLWMNSGEFQGQAGLGRCPIIGANDGNTGDAFIESGATAPITGLPRFVITRGGDYFFAPGLIALRCIADGCKFKPNDKDPVIPGDSFGKIDTPKLFDKERIRSLVARIIQGESAVTFKLPAANGSETEPTSLTPGHRGQNHESEIVFIGKHAHVSRVIEGETNEKGEQLFSIEQYTDTTRRITRGHEFVIGTEYGSNGTKTADDRIRLHDILNSAWATLNAKGDLYSRLQAIIQNSLKNALWRTEQSRSIDLVRDLASDTVYNVLTDLYGTPGPDWLTEMAVALRFSRSRIGELHPSWLSALKGEKPDNPGLTSMQIWTSMMFADIVANYQQQQDLKALSVQAGSEMMAHLDQLLARARSTGPSDAPTLVDAFIAQEKTMVAKYGYTSADYYMDVMVLLLELIGAPLMVVPSTFGSIMSFILEHRIDLSNLLQLIGGKPYHLTEAHKKDLRQSEPSGVRRLIYEAMRLETSPPILMRRCKSEVELKDGPVLKEGQWIAALMPAAGLDGSVFEKPFEFSLYPYLPGPERDITKYLSFGVYHDKDKVEDKSGDKRQSKKDEPTIPRECWGRDKLALQLLEECVKAAGQLRALRKVPGDLGEPIKMAGVTVGLRARFSGIVE